MFSAEPVCSCASSSAYCTRDRGCSAHPAFPAPSGWRDNETQTSGDCRREKAGVHLLFEIEWNSRGVIARSPHARRSPPAAGKATLLLPSLRQINAAPRTGQGPFLLVVHSGTTRRIAMQRSDVFPACQIADGGGALAPPTQSRAELPTRRRRWDKTCLL